MRWAAAARCALRGSGISASHPQGGRHADRHARPTRTRSQRSVRSEASLAFPAEAQLSWGVAGWAGRRQPRRASPWRGSLATHRSWLAPSWSPTGKRPTPTLHSHTCNQPAESFAHGCRLWLCAGSRRGLLRTTERRTASLTISPRRSRGCESITTSMPMTVSESLPWLDRDTSRLHWHSSC